MRPKTRDTSRPAAAAHGTSPAPGNMECLDPDAFRLDMKTLQESFPSLIQKVEIRLDGICAGCLRRRQRRDPDAR